jgi:stalled ribosome rescue protein Dom34
LITSFITIIKETKGHLWETDTSNNEKKIKEKKKHQTNDFLKNVINQIKKEDAFYVFGPAEMKLKLKNVIENNLELAKVKLFYKV